MVLLLSFCSFSSIIPHPDRQGFLNILLTAAGYSFEQTSVVGFYITIALANQNITNWYTGYQKGLIAVAHTISVSMLGWNALKMNTFFILGRKLAACSCDIIHRPRESCTVSYWLCFDLSAHPNLQGSLNISLTAKA